MKNQIDIYIEDQGVDVCLLVAFDYVPFRPAHVDRYGRPTECDGQEEVTIASVELVQPKTNFTIPSDSEIEDMIFDLEGDLWDAYELTEEDFFIDELL